MVAFRLSYIVPVHNEEYGLAAEVEGIAAKVAAIHPESELFLVENGSHDGSWDVAHRMTRVDLALGVNAYREANAGIGYAYHRGMLESLKVKGEGANSWILLTAADFPFGTSDLEAFLRWRATAPHGVCAIGSKAHPQSEIEHSRLRLLMSSIYRFIRFFLLGMQTGDCQGTIFIRSDIAAKILPLIKARDFFYSTELVFYLERAGYHVEELPVRLRQATRPSTVRVFKDGMRMLKQLMRLRWTNSAPPKVRYRVAH